ncbi:hypothetical protein [Nannocystis pusilla]|uniref:hypothetical protein n=1 Tax=Nannocystis pusilla TaxID=889268 RepID=UPI003B7E5B9B
MAGDDAEAEVATERQRGEQRAQGRERGGAVDRQLEAGVPLLRQRGELLRQRGVVGDGAVIEGEAIADEGEAMGVARVVRETVGVQPGQRDVGELRELGAAPARERVAGLARAREHARGLGGAKGVGEQVGQRERQHAPERGGVGGGRRIGLDAAQRRLGRGERSIERLAHERSSGRARPVECVDRLGNERARAVEAG